MQWLPLSRRTAQTSLGTTRFFLSIHLPHLSRRIPCSYWALTWVAVLPSCITLYEISVRQTRDLPGVSLFPHPASFRFHLTMDTLAFGYILPTTGRIRDFNPLEPCAARRTTQKCPAKDGGARIIFFTGSLSVHLSKTHCRAPLQDPHMYTYSQTF